jgi:hypothetical protein
MSRKDAEILRKAEYSGGFICRGTLFRYVGRITGNAGAYLIYDFQYALPPIGGTAVHTGQRLLVFDHQARYLGLYALDLPGRGQISVTGSLLSLRIPGERKRIDFSNGPPPSIFINGEVNEFNPKKD